MLSQKLNSFIFLSIFFLISNCTKKEELIINNVNAFEEYIQSEMSSQHIPALSTLIFKSDSILYEGNFGQSNIEQNLALANDHLFLLASVSKVITATALLQLNEKGLFSLDDKINDYLSFNVKVPNYNKDITFWNLLTHTSAIADGPALDDQYYYEKDSPVSLEYFLENYLVAGGEFYNASKNYYDFEPGEDYEYSNEGNALIALLVQQISGMDFSEYCKKNIFEPLGMSNSFWHLSEINQTIVQPYNYSKGEYTAIQQYTFTDYPNGGLRSTTKDLFKFLSAFVQEGKSNNYQVLKNETIKKMIIAQIPDLDKEVGLHLFLMNSENNLWGHDGGEQGVATILAFNPKTKIGVIILTNQGDANLDKMLVDTYRFGLGL